MLLSVDKVSLLMGAHYADHAAAVGGFENAGQVEAAR